MIKPLGDRVVVTMPSEDEQVSASGLFIAGATQDGPSKGTVIAVGTGRHTNDGLVPLEVSVGDEVLYSKYAGTEVEVDGDSYLVIREGDIFAVFS